MNGFFDSVFTDGRANAEIFFLCVAVALAVGIALSFLCYFKANSTKSFFIATALLPATVAVVIILVNGNIGAGIAVAGAFSLVRFRSAQGTAREICIIFVAMASGLAFGLGYLAYGALFALIVGGMFLIFSATGIWKMKPQPKEKTVTITVPEDLDYTSAFDEPLDGYTDKHELVKVKSINFGSMFRITYAVTLKDPALEKQFIDDLRRRNGNLEITVQRTDFQTAEL